MKSLYSYICLSHLCARSRLTTNFNLSLFQHLINLHTSESDSLNHINKLNRFLCYSHFKYSLPTHLVSSLFSDHNSDQLSRTNQTQGSTIGRAQGINFGRLRANFPRNVFKETSQNNYRPAKCAKEIEILSEIFKGM